MRQQGSLAQDSLAHGFEVVKRRFIAQVAQSLPHLREGQLRLVAQAEKSFSTAHLLSRSRHFQNLIRGHGVRPGFGGKTLKGGGADCLLCPNTQGNDRAPTFKWPSLRKNSATR